jgi:hypothetical protein
MKSVCQRDICSPIVIPALVIIAKKWKQAKCLPADEWMKKNVVHIHNGILFCCKEELNCVIYWKMARTGNLHIK